MAELKQLGNLADELGAHERGADTEAINRGALPAHAETIAVRAQETADGVALTPVARQAQASTARALELRESETAKLTHHLTESDRPGAAPFIQQALENFALVMQNAVALTMRQPREHLIWFAVTPTKQMAVTGDRVVVKQASMESAYSCRTCHGTGYRDVECGLCSGTGKVKEQDCHHCRILGYGRENQYSCGKARCDACRGVGWQAGIVIPDVAQSMPITGIVVSLGPDCVVSRLGDEVTYSKYAGHTTSTPAGESFTIMRESEILCLLKDIAT